MWRWILWVRWWSGFLLVRQNFFHLEIIILQVPCIFLDMFSRTWRGTVIRIWIVIPVSNRMLFKFFGFKTDICQTPISAAMLRRKKHLRNIRSVCVDPEKNNWKRKHDGSKRASPGRSDKRRRENKVSLQLSILKRYFFKIIHFDTRAFGSRKKAKKENWS